jgi:hypothetical protein
LQWRGLEYSGTALLTLPTAVAPDRHHVAVVQEPVRDRGRHHRIAEHGVPFADRLPQGPLASGRGVEQAVELITDRGELQPTSAPGQRPV